MISFTMLSTWLATNFCQTKLFLVLGGLIDHVISTHPAYAQLKTQSEKSGVSVYQILEQTLDTLSAGGHVSLLTRDLHVYPDYHGNRSPLSDPGMTGAVVGLTLNNHHVHSLALQVHQLIS